MSLIKTATNSIGMKIIMVFVLGFLLLIPMVLIEGIVADRKNYQAEAVGSIIEPIGGNLQLDGIIKVIPYTVKVVDKDDKESYIVKHIYITPETYTIEGDVDVNTLNRGIFNVPVFSSELKVKGNFENYNPDNYSTILWDNAFLVIGSKKKNFIRMPDIKVNGNSLKEYEGSTSFDIHFFDDMFVFKLPEEYARNNFDFDVSFDVQGGNYIAIRPLESQNTFTISSEWTDPSFTGGWLPTERNFTDDGFKAVWNIPGFQISFDEEPYITTSFLLLNDNYQKTTRSIKYAILFIFIPFFALLLCELLSKKVLHIIQYCLIGFANVIFFLLLLSISEHLSFNLSYLMGTIMVTSVVSLYVNYIMASKKLGLTIAGVQSVAYIFLFVMLQLTDYSLLVGSLGLFTVIALGMYLTRNIDWFNFVSSKEE